MKKNDVWSILSSLKHDIDNERIEIKCTIDHCLELQEKMDDLYEQVENMIINAERMGY